MKKHKPVPRTRTFRVVAWANIITQLLFPVAASLTPVWVSAAAKSQNEIQYTQVYKLKTGETVVSVAKQHHLTVNQLKKINQFRTFSKPFTALSTGDEIDIPWDNAPGVSDNHSTDAATSSDVFWADSSTQVANALKSGDPSKVALDKARGLATDAATQEIQNWLKGYGTARVKLGVDDKARLEGSELDLLLPLYDTQNQLTYTQMGLRHVDKRTTANIGVGQRLFLTDQMLGYNTFLDHDISGNHTRMGVGAEYWRDYLKLGANGYFRLSGWRNADNLEGYDARPANGFDLRGEAYLPAYPQLGGKLMYEQYFGDEVGLFGKNKRQKDPGAVTLGVNYTPFPLLTVGIDRRQGTDHGGETQFNLGLRYELGTPWAKQIDTSTVDKLRSLAGSRYDLVDRNNQIVLEYRKQEHVRLALAGHIEGRAGETKSLGVNATATKGIRNIEWQAASLEAHGGKILETSLGQYSVILPTWQANGQNQYTVTGIAYDRDGKASEPASTQISVTSASISTENTTFTANPAQLPPDGKSTSTLTLTVKDADGNPVPGQADRLTLDISGDSDIKTSSAKEVAPGVYEVTVTAGTTTGTTTITPVIDGVNLNPVVMTVGSVANAENSTFTANPAQLPPDGKSTSVLTLTVKDADGNPVSGETDKLVLNVSGDSDVTLSPATEIAPGVYQATLTAGTTQGTATITPVVEGVTLNPLQMAISASVSPENSTFTANPAQLPADGTGTSTLTLTVKDADGNPVSGQADQLALNVSGDGDVTLSPVTEIAPGIYQATLTAGTTQGTATITPVVEGVSLTPVVMTLGSAQAPSVSALHLHGQLAVGQSLSGTYAFDANGGNPTDASTYAWGDKGQTGQAVSSGQTITTSGQVPEYALTVADIGKIKEVSVQAKNGLAVTGNMATLATDATPAEGNDTTGGNEGQIIDPTETPQVTALSLHGTLSVGDTLSATYQYVPGPNANTVLGVAAPAVASLTDKSTYAWGDKGQTAQAVSSGASVEVSGQVPGYTLTSADIGKVKEVSVQAKNSVNVVGNIQTLATDATPAEGNDTTGGNDEGEIIDPAAQPGISALSLHGQLAVGQSLAGAYTFDANGGNPTDASTYAWGDKGQTGQAVGSGQTIATSGQVPEYTLTAADIGKIKEVSVQAKNGLAITGNTATLATDAAQAEGNDTTGGDGHGGIVDAGATPIVSAVKLTGELAVGSTLHGTYTFDANGGDTSDISTYAWGNKGQTAQEVSSGASVEVSGQVPGHTLTSSDVGLVKEMSVQAKNHLQVTGNTVTIATDASANEGNETHGGDSDGKIIDSAGQPLIAGLHLQGQLAVGQLLSGVYTFNANGGNPTDASTYAWGDKGQTSQAVGSGQTITTSGQVPEYTLTAADIGKIKEVSVQAKNGLAVIGNTETLATDAGAGEGNDTTGGNEGQIIDPAAQPVLSQLVLHGTLEVHNELVGRYTFDANGGDATDHSTYVWGDKGTTNTQVASGETITESGDVPAYTLTPADIGKIKEVSVQAKNGLTITGNTLTVATDAAPADGNETDGGDDHGGIVDAGAPPSINAVTLSGELAMGSTLTSTYTWVANGGEPNEKTEVLWGPKGETADDVLVHGVPVTTLGETTHTLTAQDVGQVLEVALLPKNGFGVEGDVVTLATDAPASEGNATTGGDEGHIINPTAIPSVMQLSISGDLALFGNLSGTYQFNANGGSTEDVSLYLWGEKGTTANDVLNAGQPVLASGVVGHYALLSTDAGKVLELSVLPKNGNAITGDAKTVATDASASEGNNTTGGDDGHIINPAAIPSVEGLHLLGSLAVGSDLTATYTFNANTGNAVDNSQYLWGDKGQTAGEVMASGQAVVTSGQVQAYTLTTEDVGKVKEVSVLAKNGLDVTGNTETLATDASESDGNDTTGGNGEGGIIDPTASPSVSELKLAGILTTGQSLSATYTFAGNGGDATDHSTYVWGTKGNTAGNVANGQTITTSGQVPDLTLTAADVGTIKEVSVQAKNGLNVTGNTATLATDATPAEGNDTTGGNGGEIAAPAFDHIAVNGFNFAPNSGFPTTGFVNATFTLALNNANASDYNWASSASWVSVDGTGKVTFTAEPAGQEQVTITATPKTGNGESFSHRFTVNRWYQYNATLRTWSAANSYCNGLGNGYALPTRVMLSNGKYAQNNSSSRAVGGYLWSEWGNLATYGFATTDNTYWTSEAHGSGYHYGVHLTTGYINDGNDAFSAHVSCQRGL